MPPGNDHVLVEANADLAGSYFDMMQAASDAGEGDRGYRVPDVRPYRRNPAAFLRSLYQWKHGIDLGPGLVPMDTWWLVRRDRPDVVLGETRTRHCLSPALDMEGGHVGYFIHPQHRGQGLGHVILRLALEKLSDRGISQVLVTCDADNEPSRRVIEAAGGQFDGFSHSPRRGVLVSRFWIANPIREQPW